MTAVGISGYRPEAWAAGPERVYDELSRVLLDHWPSAVPLAGAMVLDVGMGTGVVSRALRQRGARALGVDVEPAMVAWTRAQGLDAVAGDACALPLPARSVDGWAGAFVLNHLDRPRLALAEAARVVRPGGPVLAATFRSGGPEHPVKLAVEAAAARFGYVRPAWYDEVKRRLVPQVGEPARLAGVAEAAGLSAVAVSPLSVCVGALEPREQANWRLGMAMYTEWLAGLDAGTRAEAEAAAEAEVAARLGPAPQALVLDVLILCSRAPA